MQSKKIVLDITFSLPDSSYNGTQTLNFKTDREKFSIEKLTTNLIFVISILVAVIVEPDLLVVKLQRRQVLPCFAELALLHTLTHKPDT